MNDRSSTFGALTPRALPLHNRRDLSHASVRVAHAVAHEDNGPGLDVGSNGEGEQR